MTAALAEPITPRRPSSDSGDPFRIGYRYVNTVDAGGAKTSRQVPLTEEDFLHPKEEDKFTVSLEHTATLYRLIHLIDYGQRSMATSGVTGELRIDWQVPGVQPHGPDVIAFDRYPDEVPPNTGTLRVADLGLTCEAVFEITSPETRHIDFGPKLEEYLLVGVPFYFVVDFANPHGDARLLCFRHGGDRYRLLTGVPGRGYQVPNLGLWFRLDGRTMMASDRHGVDIPTSRELGAAADAEKARADAEKRRADAERLRADAEKFRGEAARKQADAEKARVDAEKASADAERRRADELTRELAELKARLSAGG